MSELASDSSDLLGSNLARHLSSFLLHYISLSQLMYILVNTLIPLGFQLSQLSNKEVICIHSTKQFHTIVPTLKFFL